MKSILVYVAILAAVIGAIVVAAIALQPESRWIATHATQIHVGTWVADIPPGWRDIHELRKPIAAFPVPGARTLLLEKETGVGEIDVFPLPAVHGDGCQTLADSLKAQTSGMDFELRNAQGASYAGDPGCMISITVQGQLGLFLTRSHAGVGVAVRCIGEGASLDGGSACDKIIYGLRIGD